MKAVQTRSPIHLAYEYANLNNVIVSIWVDDSPNIDSTTTPDYQLNSQAINDFATVEISELIRSKNDYIFNPDFYEKRDTAKYVLIRGELLDDNQSQLEVKYDFLRVRDGYVTREGLPQIFINLIPTDVRDWDSNFNNTITASQQDPFNGTNAFLIDDTNDSQVFATTDPLNLKGVYTFSVFLKPSLSEVFAIGFGQNKRVVFNIVQDKVIFFTGDVISYDLFPIGDWSLVSVCYEIDETDVVRIVSENASADERVFLFNPKVTKGNKSANDLVLQDNKTIFSTSLINTKIGFDKKLANTTYNFNGTDLTFTNQSVYLDTATSDLTYDQLDGTVTTQQITRQTINECKHTPTKVSFINRFGVIQDLVFFKKRTDSIDTDKEGYVTNVLQQGNYYSHIGQNQTIRKESKQSVTLNTGFYPEEFNTVFEQLQNSLHYWIDDEPAVLEGSSFNVKTRVNDKLINYTFDFSYSNREVNTI